MAPLQSPWATSSNCVVRIALVDLVRFGLVWFHLVSLVWLASNWRARQEEPGSERDRPLSGGRKLITQNSARDSELWIFPPSSLEYDFQLATNSLMASHTNKHKALHVSRVLVCKRFEPAFRARHRDSLKVERISQTHLPINNSANELTS